MKVFETTTHIIDNALMELFYRGDHVFLRNLHGVTEELKIFYSPNHKLLAERFKDLNFENDDASNYNQILQYFIDFFII